MKNLIIAPLALVLVALTLSGCFFPGRYHDRYDGGRPAGPYVGGGGGYEHPHQGY